MIRATIQVVTDPMCSWCWGMAPALEQAMAQLNGEYAFELLLGGVNLHGTQPIGDYGRRLLRRIWQEVEATTGQRFATEVPADFVFNSLLPCALLYSVRHQWGHAPFGLLHRLQQRFFAEGVNINDPEELSLLAREYCPEFDDAAAVIRQTAAGANLRAEFAAARRYGTQALPALLLEVAGERRLLLGGYADADTIAAAARQALPSRLP